MYIFYAIRKLAILKEITDNNPDVADIRNYYFKSAVASHPSIILIKGKVSKLLKMYFLSVKCHRLIY